jgi:hypothetical protein
MGRFVRRRRLGLTVQADSASGKRQSPTTGSWISSPNTPQLGGLCGKQPDETFAERAIQTARLSMQGAIPLRPSGRHPAADRIDSRRRAPVMAPQVHSHPTLQSRHRTLAPGDLTHAYPVTSMQTSGKPGHGQAPPDQLTGLSVYA